MRVPDTLSVYTTLYRFDEAWLHVDFLTKHTPFSNFKFNVKRKRWILLHVEIKSKDIIVQVEDEYNFYTKHLVDYHGHNVFIHRKEYFLRKFKASLGWLNFQILLLPLGNKIISTY